MASVSVGVWVGVGGRHEPEALSGISHFIEHLLFKGTRRRSAAEISQAVEGIGGYLNAFTDEEHTCLYARAQASRLGDLVDVLLDMFLESKLSPAEIRRERDVIFDEMAMYRDQPTELMHDVLNAAQFPNHPLGRAVIGTKKTLTNLRRSHFEAYLASHYVTEATVIAAAGNLDHAELVEMVRQRESQFRRGARPSGSAPTERTGRPAVKTVTKTVEQANIGLGFRTCSRHDPRRFALRLLNVVLGENMSSRLFQVVREEHGLTYNIHSSLSFWGDCGDVVIAAGLDAGELEKTVRLVVAELQRLARRPPGNAEFERARDYLLGQLDLQLENTENHMMTLGEQWLAYGRLFEPAESKARLCAVKPAELKAAAQAFFRPERLAVALVSPARRQRPLDRLLNF
jgi:predicted Zn-dependent peptidase